MCWIYASGHTCEDEFPFVQQTPVRNQIIQCDSLQKMFQILKESSESH